MLKVFFKFNLVIQKLYLKLFLLTKKALYLCEQLLLLFYQLLFWLFLVNLYLLKLFFHLFLLYNFFQIFLHHFVKFNIFQIHFQFPQLFLKYNQNHNLKIFFCVLFQIYLPNYLSIFLLLQKLHLKFFLILFLLKNQ